MRHRASAHWGWVGPNLSKPTPHHFPRPPHTGRAFVPVVECKAGDKTRSARTTKRHMSIRKKVRVVKSSGCGGGRSGSQSAPLPNCSRLAHCNSHLQVSGTTERPRLAVFRSNQHIYAQVRGNGGGGGGSGGLCARLDLQSAGMRIGAADYGVSCDQLQCLQYHSTVVAWSAETLPCAQSCSSSSSSATQRHSWRSTICRRFPLLSSPHSLHR